MTVKMVNEFKLTVVQTRYRSVHARGFTAGQKNCAKSGLGHRASAPPGSRAAGPSRAVGRGPAFSKTQVGRDKTQHFKIFEPCIRPFNMYATTSN